MWKTEKIIKLDFGVIGVSRDLCYSPFCAGTEGKVGSYSRKPKHKRKSDSQLALKRHE